MICPLSRDVAKPCPRKPCDACADDLAERAALIADGCRLTQPQADKIAIEQALAAMPRVLVCGGRDFADYALVKSALSKLPAGTSFCHGGARGADALAQRFSTESCLPVRCFPAEWDKHGKGAGPIRNQRMLDEFKPNVVVAFPGGPGTSDMVSRAKRAGIEVREIDPASMPGQVALI